MKLSTLLVFLITSPCCLFSQIFYNNGATIWTGSQSIIGINGGLENNSSTSNGDFEHNGQMWVTLNSTLYPNPGDVTLNNNSTLHGNGYYNVEQNWVNNATFTADNSTVELYGNLQEMITGTVVTTFHNLTLTGTGSGNNKKKSQTLDANVDATGTFTINDRELDTDVNTLFVLNSSSTCVTNNTTAGSEGFVSSVGVGRLSRATSTTAAYLFPTGSSLGTTRYRPVLITPSAATNNTYAARLANNLASIDTYDTSLVDTTICQVNPDYYHRIDRTFGTSDPAIAIYFDPAADGIWDGLAQWNIPTITWWNNMGTVTPASAQPPALSGLEAANWANISPIGNNDPYILTRMKPVTPFLACPDSFCKFSPAVWFTSSGVAVSYNWTVNGGTIVSGQGTDSILVSWGGTSGTVSVVASGLGPCPSLPANCTVNLAPSPFAGFDTISIGPFNNTWNFIDSATAPPLTWTWNFGDGDTSSVQNPIHYYPQAGTYTVTQIVTNQFGCLDTITKILVVNEGILVPNVFTPDANGQNDVWYIPNSGVKEFHVTIFDRWGAKVFETTADEIRWDGHSLAGQLLTDGTYFYTLDFIYIRSTGEEMKNLTGTVTLLTSSRTK